QTFLRNTPVSHRFPAIVRHIGYIADFVVDRDTPSIRVRASNIRVLGLVSGWLVSTNPINTVIHL
ncbi:MAG: hypothetical protein FWC91_09845, partial [Defluviitaleaceae bacterium]|nr:hypothetical protein [Defluviitaleaceae bacterium]